MKKVIYILLFFTLFMSSCGQEKEQSGMPDTSDAIAAQVIVDQFIKAYETYDAESLIALLHEDYIFMDYGLDDGPLGKGNIAYFIKESMAEADTWEVKFDSYTITPNGLFAVLDGSFSMEAKSSDEMLTVPAYVVLEIKDGKVVNETWYYNGEVFH
jgi:hypothetical protein